MLNATFGNGSDFWRFRLLQAEKALLGPHVIGVVPVVHGHHAVLQLPNAVDDLDEEPAVVRDGD